MTNIPRSRHNEPECVAAKTKELKDFQNYDVYEVVDKPENKNKEFTSSRESRPQSTRSLSRFSSPLPSVKAGTSGPAT